jgi:hypothetical protein
MKTALLIGLVMLQASRASWVCPVFENCGLEWMDFNSLKSGVLWNSLEVVITPVPVTEENIRSFADWNYLIREEFTVVPGEDRQDLLFCLDLGVGPEGIRELVSLTVGGDPFTPCSVLVRRLYPEDQDTFSDTRLCILREHPGSPQGTPCVLESLADYRALFSDDEEFWSAVPETARTYAVLIEAGSGGGPAVVEIEYLVRGWTYLLGAEPLRYSLYQPSLWMGAASEASILVDLSGIPDGASWKLDFMGETFTGDDIPLFRIPAPTMQFGDRGHVITIFPPEITDPL